MSLDEEILEIERRAWREAVSYDERDELLRERWRNEGMPDARALMGRIADLEAQAAALREALEHCRHRPHEHNPPPEFTITRCDVIDRALAPDSGQAFLARVRAEEREACAKLVEAMNHFDDEYYRYGLTRPRTAAAAIRARSGDET